MGIHARGHAALHSSQRLAEYPVHGYSWPCIYASCWTLDPQNVRMIIHPLYVQW